MFPLHRIVFNLLHALHEHKTKPAVKIDSGLPFYARFLTEMRCKITSLSVF